MVVYVYKMLKINKKKFILHQRETLIILPQQTRLCCFLVVCNTGNHSNDLGTETNQETSICLRFLAVKKILYRMFRLIRDFHAALLTGEITK